MSQRFRTAKWLQSNGFAPQVFVFRNLESGQVLYSQVPYFSSYQINKQFQRPNWENKKPSTRRDIWRVMSVVNLPSYEASVQVYQDLTRLRHLRDVAQKEQAQQLRKKNEDGNIWFSGQYRPTFSQEAVADLKHALEVSQTEAQVYWENEWRKGEAKHWESLAAVEHKLLEKVSPREEFPMLKELRDMAKLEFSKLREEESLAKEVTL